MQPANKLETEIIVCSSISNSISKISTATLVITETQTVAVFTLETPTEASQLTMEMTRRSNYNLNPRKLLTKQSHCQNCEAAVNEKRTNSPQWSFVRSSI